MNLIHCLLHSIITLFWTFFSNIWLSLIGDFFSIFQRWLNSLQEHTAYSTHYTNQPHIVLMDELDEDYLPLGSMQDALKVKLFLCWYFENIAQFVLLYAFIIKTDFWERNVVAMNLCTLFIAISNYPIDLGSTI